MDNTVEYIDNSRRSTVQEKFSPSVMWLRDTGTLNKIKFDVLNPSISIPDAKVRLNQPLILRQLGIIMIILLVGLTVAFIVFLYELWMSRSKDNT